MKNTWPTFRTTRIIAHNICQATIYRGPQSKLTNIVQMIRSFAWDLRGWSKQSFQKWAVFTMTKVIGPFFFVSSGVTNIGEQIVRIHKLFWQLLWNLKERFLRPKRLLKTQTFEKMAIFPVKKRFGTFFLIEHAKCQETNYNGPQGTLTNIMQMIRSFVWDLGGR